jgi:hypothetical protein
MNSTPVLTVNAPIRFRREHLTVNMLTDYNSSVEVHATASDLKCGLFPSRA